MAIFRRRREKAAAIPGDPEASVAVRTHYEDEAAWRRLRERLVAVDSDGFQAALTFVEDQRFAGLSPDDVQGLLPADFEPSFLFIVDETSMTSAEGNVLVLSLGRPPAREPFRVIPSKVWSVENNLSLWNMGYKEFADAVDDDGVFRGF